MHIDEYSGETREYTETETLMVPYTKVFLSFITNNIEDTFPVLNEIGFSHVLVEVVGLLFIDSWKRTWSFIYTVNSFSRLLKPTYFGLSKGSWSERDFFESFLFIRVFFSFTVINRVCSIFFLVCLFSKNFLIFFDCRIINF